MSVDQAAVRRIAHLARIAVSDAEVPHLQGEINAILSFVAALDEVDVQGVEPMTSVIPMKLPMREDVVSDGEIASLGHFQRLFGGDGDIGFEALGGVDGVEMRRGDFDAGKLAGFQRVARLSEREGRE